MTALPLVLILSRLVVRGYTAAVKGTASGIAAVADAGSGADVLEGDSAWTARVDCPRNRDDCCFRPKVHQSCAFGLTSSSASSQSLLPYQSDAGRYGRYDSSTGSLGGQLSLKNLYRLFASVLTSSGA
jgi:hypothetical protein